MLQRDALDALLGDDGIIPPDPSRPAIVVVDDDPTMRKSLEVLLRDDYRVTVCASAQEGVDAVEDVTCAVILDVRMKGYDGFWACDEMRKRYPDVPVIFYSGYQDVDDPYRVINEHRPFGYITKDHDSAKLLATVATAVRLHKMTLDNKRFVAQFRGAAGTMK